MPSAAKRPTPTRPVAAPGLNNPYMLMCKGRWKRLRRAFLFEHPLCEHCNVGGIRTRSREVNHRKAHKGDLALFWNQENWQALCRPCLIKLKR